MNASALINEDFAPEALREYPSDVCLHLWGYCSEGIPLGTADESH